MAEVARSFGVQQSPASEGARPHRPFLLGVLLGGLAVGGLVAVAPPGREGAQFVATPVGVAPLGSGASFGGVRQRATSPMMAAGTRGNVGGVGYLFPGRREALATGAAGFAAGVGLLSGASEARAADENARGKATEPEVLAVDAEEDEPEATPVATPAAEESELVRGLLARSKENAEENERNVRQKTLKNSMGAQFAPWSRDAPVMKPDGSFEIVTVSALERYRGKKWVFTNANGLDEWAEGYDAAAALAAEAKKAGKGKFLGLF